MKATLFPTAALLATCLIITGCPPPKEAGGHAPEGEAKAGSAAEGKALVTIGDSRITVETFKERLMRQSPFLRARYNTPERKKQFLDNMVRFELLAREAERRGLAKDPDVQETMKKVMVQKLIRQLNEDDKTPLPEADLTAFYEAHLSDYVKPERARLAQIFVKGSDAEARKKMRAIKTEVEQRAKEATAFQMIAREKSDDAASRSVGGDLGYHTRDEVAALWGPTVAEAAFGLEKVGEMSTIVTSDRGLHLLKLTGKQKALNRTFDQVKMQIEGRVRREQRTSLFDDFVTGLREKEGVTIDEALLETIEISAAGVGLPGAPAAPGLPGKAPTGLPPGHPRMIPPGSPAGAPGGFRAPPPMPGPNPAKAGRPAPAPAGPATR